MTWAILKDFMRFLYKRDSEATAILIILVGNYMTANEMRQIGEYFLRFAEERERKGERNVL